MSLLTKEKFQELLELSKQEKLNNRTASEVILLEQNYKREHPVCIKCGNKNNLTYDHIIPRCILLNLNIDPYHTYMEENGQILCSACNHMKSSNLDFSNPKTKELLLKYINEIK